MPAVQFLAPHQNPLLCRQKILERLTCHCNRPHDLRHDLFTVTGPQSPSVFTNMAASIEQHVDWIAECVAFVRREGAAEIDAAADAEEEWVAHASAVAAPTLYARALSWYTGSNVPNKPRVLLGYLGGFDNYTAKCNDVAAHGYQGFVLS